jgi:predicted polyphosphate/ATP-dependent NAD kinase
MSKTNMPGTGLLGLIVNPHSGRDARRLFARAGTSTIDDKRNQVTRIVVGAAAAGCRKLLLSKDAFRITSSAVDALRLPIECEILDLETTGHGVDSQRAALAMREAGCSALVALGGDGTSRAISLVWPDVVLLPLSTGTNNVFPFEVEARSPVRPPGSSRVDACHVMPRPTGPRSSAFGVRTGARAWR